jgi:PAS domain S-box-containing protein
MNTIALHSMPRAGNTIGDGMVTLSAVNTCELQYNRLFEAAQEGIMILDLYTGRIDDVNPFLTKLLGFSRDEIVGKQIGELSPFKELVSHQAMLELLQQYGHVGYEDLPLEAKDGRHLIVELVSNVYQIGDKKVIQCNIRDIVERRKFEQSKMQPKMRTSNLKRGGLDLDPAQKFNQLERENSELKKKLTETQLENRNLKMVVATKSKSSL